MYQVIVNEENSDRKIYATKVSNVNHYDVYLKISEVAISHYNFFTGLNMSPDEAIRNALGEAKLSQSMLTRPFKLNSPVDTASLQCVKALTSMFMSRVGYDSLKSGNIDANEVSNGLWQRVLEPESWGEAEIQFLFAQLVRHGLKDLHDELLTMTHQLYEEG